MNSISLARVAAILFTLPAVWLAGCAQPVETVARIPQISAVSLDNTNAVIFDAINSHWFIIQAPGWTWDNSGRKTKPQRRTILQPGQSFTLTEGYHGSVIYKLIRVIDGQIIVEEKTIDRPPNEPKATTTVRRIRVSPYPSVGQSSKDAIRCPSGHTLADVPMLPGPPTADMAAQERNGKGIIQGDCVGPPSIAHVCLWCRIYKTEMSNWQPVPPAFGLGESIALPVIPLSQEEIGFWVNHINDLKRADVHTLHRALVCDQTYLRAKAAEQLGETGDATSISHLIEALSDESIHDGVEYLAAGMETTRYWANESLKKLTKLDFGFRWNAAKVEREASVKRWKKWFSEQEFADLVRRVAEPESNSLLGITVTPSKSEFEVGERASCGFEITNLTSEAIALPGFRFPNLKQEAAEVAFFYVKEQILEIAVRQGTNTVAMQPGWQNTSKQAGQYPTEFLEPAHTIRGSLSLTQNWPPSFFALTNPGIYSVGITLDTRACKDARIPKGVYVSPRAAFGIVPVAEFRAKRPDESLEAYVQARVTFYLKRITQHKGEGFPNVRNIVRTEGAVAALIEVIGSPDKDTADRSLELLNQLHHALGRPNPPPMPESVADWRTWLKETGSRLTPNELWANFDSHYQ